MDDIIQTHRASSPSSLLIVGVVILLALVAFASVAQADVKIFVVNTTDDPGNGVCNPDPGSCTLRDAIWAANAHPNDASGRDIIVFTIGTGHQTIMLQTQQVSFPVITDPVIIDGTSQPGFFPKGVPLIELDGRNVTQANAGSANGLTITAGGSTVKGLIINHFKDNGILLSTKGPNTITGNYIGTNDSGNGAAPNGDGIFILDSPNNDIGGADHDAGVCNKTCNVISGNGLHGIEIRGVNSGFTKVQGNFIGVGVNGMAKVPNDQDGVSIDLGEGGATIGGDHDVGMCNGACNLISGNGLHGIEKETAVLHLSAL